MSLRVDLTEPMAMEGERASLGAEKLGGRQVRLVLVMLLLERHRGVSRDELAEVLWPEKLPPSWEPALRGVISKVRSLLAEAVPPASDVLTVAFGCYQPLLPADVVVDVELAAAAVEAAERCLSEGKLEKACDYAVAARAIARRPFLPGEAAPWVTRVRERLATGLLRSLETLSHARSLRGEIGAAVEAAEEAVSLEPLRESAHRCLMAAHAAGANRGAALRAYERCRRILAEELGVDPSTETRNAYLELLGQEPTVPATPNDSEVPSLPDDLRIATPLVGREAELRRLTRTWEKAKGGSLQLVILTGDAGMGKSALAAQVAHSARSQGATVLSGRCDRHLLIPFQPIAEAFSRYLNACPEERLRDHLSSTPEIVILVPELRGRLPDLAFTASGDLERDRHRLVAAVAAFLAEAAAVRPLVLVIEDLHWAGPAVLLLLRYVVRTVASSAVLIIVTARDDHVPIDSTVNDTLMDLRRESRVHHIALDGLGPTAVAELASHVLGDELGDESRELTSLLVEEAGGNPLFVGELLHHIVDSHLPPLGPRLHGATSLTEIGIPRTVREVIVRQRAALSELAQKALTVAAVVGREFEFDIVQHVTGADDELLFDAMEEGNQARLIGEAPSSVGLYRFTHGLVRDVLYEEVATARRARLHGRIGEAIEEVYGDKDVRVPQLAHHFGMAGPSFAPEKALHYTVRAGEDALAQLGYEKAATHFQRVLQLGLDAPGQEARRCQVLMSLATAHRKAGNVGEARQTYLSAAALARHIRHPAALATCALGLAGGGRAVSAWIADEVRISLLEEALEVLDEDESELRVHVLAELAKALYFSSEKERRDALVREAVEMARRIGDPSGLAGALSARRLLLPGPGNIELRLMQADEMLAAADEAGDLEVCIRGRLARLADLFEFGERPVVDREVEGILSLAHEVGQPYYLWRAKSWEALRAILDGRFMDAERLAKEGLTLWPRDVNPDAANCFVIQFATMSILRSHPGEAIEPVRRVAMAYPMVPSFRCLLALLTAEAGQHVEAASEFERFAADGFTVPPLDANWLFGMAALAQTCSVLRDTARARMLYSLLLPFSRRMVAMDAFGGGAGFLGPVSHHLGSLAALMGDRDEAERHFDEALAASTRFGWRPNRERGCFSV